MCNIARRGWLGVHYMYWSQHHTPSAIFHIQHDQPCSK